jgi:hypothetical protein
MKMKKLIYMASGLLLMCEAGYAKLNVGHTSQTPANNTVKRIAADCARTSQQFDLKINNVRARILNGGDLWWDPIGQIPYYEVPQGSNKNCIYAGAIWITGLDVGGNILAACQTYRQTGANDFYAGPVSQDANGLLNVSTTTCDAYDRFWVSAKSEVEAFANGGEALSYIKEWPGNGNVANGELPLLAPFIDVDADGIYNWAAGDYPAYNLTGEYPVDPITGGAACNDYLFGDKNVWWVFNDVGNSHTETNSPNPIGLEVRAQAFAFKTADEINFMTFYKYQIINRSTNTLNSTYMGVWCDPDLGNAADDYVGCNVNLGLGYVYNADPDDDGADGYGVNPPAVGIDFFQGPLADASDGIDNDLDGTIDEPGEQIIMSKFIQYKNDFSNQGNPEELSDYHGYLSGHWKDGTDITYGGSGVGGGTPCNYMFPGLTDPVLSPTLGNWTMSSAGIAPDDMRFIQSAGTFTLTPGAVNYVTTGVVFARASSGGPGASITLMELADAKAQALFDNCFKVLDGPNAPDLVIREMDKRLLFSLENTSTSKVEFYHELDPTIPAQIPNPNDTGFITLTDEQRSYDFEGYRIYQLRDRNVGGTIEELSDISKARLIRQIDKKNNIYKIVNFTFNNDLGVWFPQQVADSNSTTNLGLYHELEVTTDYFTGQDLINYKPYYYTIVSYAYNNYMPFDPNNAAFTQSIPYKQGRLNVKVYSGIPHKPVVNFGGVAINAEYGQSFSVKRIEGQGNGGNVLDLTQESINEILGTGSRALYPVYEPGRGPVKLRVYDPLRVAAGDLALAFDGSNADSTHWYLMTSNQADTIATSTYTINNKNIQIVPQNGLALDIYSSTDYEIGSATGNNGFLEATLSDNASIPWLSWLADNESGNAAGQAIDWIRTGGNVSDVPGDPDQIFEDVLGGTWAPVKFTNSDNTRGIKPSSTFVTGLDNFMKFPYIASIDFVITADKSKWTRAIVFEMGAAVNGTEGGAGRWEPRRARSVDQNGNDIGNGGSTGNTVNDATFISDSSMGWFPGYAINVETGERLNIGFAENSSTLFANSERGRDMKWNPTSNITNAAGDTVLGGMHFIYVFGHNLDGVNDVPRYDSAQVLVSRLKGATPAVKRSIWKDAMWASIPLTTEAASASFANGIPKSEMKVRLRVAKMYRPFISANAPDTINGGNPYYQFSIPQSAAPGLHNNEIAKGALDLIRVVPNPYYAYSSYENTRENQLDNRIRITNLPSTCKISIYTLNGTLIRQFERDVREDVSFGEAVVDGKDVNLSSTFDWDLKNTAGIPISSGVYYIHIDAGPMGEKVLKWLGVMRPIDLDTF